MEVLGDAQATVRQNVEKVNSWRVLLTEEAAWVVPLEVKLEQLQQATKYLQRTG